MDTTKAYQLYLQYSKTCLEADFDLFFYETRDLVHRVSYHYVKSNAESEDVFQSVYLKLFLYGKENSQKIGDIENFKSWLVSVVVNVSKMATRKEIRQKERDLKKTMSESIQNEDQAELIEKIKSTISILPEKYRLPVCLHYMEDLSFSDMASILKTEATTLKVQASRGIQKIRDHLEKAGVTLSVVSLELLLRKNMYPAAPENIVLQIKSLKPSSRLEQIIHTSKNHSVNNMSWVFKALIGSVFISIITSIYLHLSPTPVAPTTPQFERKTVKSTSQATSTNMELNYNFEKEMPLGVTIPKLDGNDLVIGKGLSIAKGNNTLLEFSNAKLSQLPLVIEEEVFTFPDPAILQGTYNLAIPENLWYRPVSTNAYQWNKFKVFLIHNYEVIFLNNRPFKINKLSLDSSDLNQSIKILFNNVILKNVSIHSPQEVEINAIQKFLDSMLNNSTRELSSINLNNLINSEFSDVYLLPEIKQLHKPLKIKIEFYQNVSSLKDFQVLFLDSEISATKVVYGNLPVKNVPFNHITLYIYDSIVFLGIADSTPEVYFESESKILNPECGFVVKKELMKSMIVESVKDEEQLYKLARMLFRNTSHTKLLTIKNIKDN